MLLDVPTVEARMGIGMKGWWGVFPSRATGQPYSALGSQLSVVPSRLIVTRRASHITHLRVRLFHLDLVSRLCGIGGKLRHERVSAKRSPVVIVGTACEAEDAVRSCRGHVCWQCVVLLGLYRVIAVRVSYICMRRLYTCSYTDDTKSKSDSSKRRHDCRRLTEMTDDEYG